MDRPKRQRRAPQTYQAEATERSIKGYWSLTEKEKLFDALKKYGKDDLNRLEKALRPKKTKAQIAHYLQTLLSKQPKDAMKEEAPIETWLRLSNELTTNDTDYSDILANVISICGNLEPHLPSKKASEVDYPAIYRYLDCLLRGGVEFPRMNELTVAILLDVLQSMADTLKTLDLSVQRRLMAEKYKLLKGKVSVNNPVHYEAARKALENDIELNGVMAMTERVPYPHQVQATERYSRWNKRKATPGSSGISSPAASQGAAASSSAASPQATAAAVTAAAATAAAAAGQPPAKRLKLLPGVKITPGTYKLSPQDLQILLQSLNQPDTQPAPSTVLPIPPVPTRVQTCLPSGANTGEKEDGIQGGAMVNLQSAGLMGEQTNVQSGAKQVSQYGEEPRSELQSGEKRVTPDGEGPRSELQTGAKQVPQAGDESRNELQIGAKQVTPDGEGPMREPQSRAKQVSQDGEEPRSELQSGAKQVTPDGEGPRSEPQSGARQVSQDGEGPMREPQSGAKQVSQDGEEPRSEPQSGAKQVSQDGEGPRSELQSGAKEVTPGGDKPGSEVQSGAKQVTPGGDEPGSELKSGAKQVSQSGEEPRSELQNATKETPEQIGEESRVPSAANCELTANSSQNSVTPKASTSKVTEQTDVNHATSTPSGSTDVTQPVPNTPDGIQILDKVVVSSNREVGQKWKPVAKLPKRTSLFSLNPLCVPVRYLKPNKIQIPCAFEEMTQDPDV